MFDLFKYELQRFGRYALITFFGYLAILGYLITQKPLLDHTQMQEMIIVMVAVLGGLIFGALQMWLHKRKSYWTYLVHRPLSPQRIYHGLAGAGALLAVAVASLPFLFATFTVDIFDRELVESRHYLYSLHIAAIALFSYLLGTYTVLNPSWGALLSIGSLFFMLMTVPTSASATLLVDAAYVACMYYLSIQSFKVNLTTHFTKKRQLFLAAILMQPGLSLLILLSQAVYYHIPLTIAGTHPDRYEKEQLDGYLSQSWKWAPEEMIREVLSTNNNGLSQHQIDALAKQVELVKSRSTSIEPLPSQVFGQIINKDADYAIADKTNKTTWLFSHREQVLIGRDIYSREIKGAIGKNGFITGAGAISNLTQEDRFEQIPWLTSDRFIQTRTTLYIVDFSGQFLEIKHQLQDPDEYYTNEVQVDADNNLAILTSNKGLYVFDLAAINELNSYSEPYLFVNYHRDLYDARYVRYFVLVDGLLFKYADRDYFGFDQPGIGLVYAKNDGTTEILGERAFNAARPLPVFVNDQQYWQSPIFMDIFYNYARSQYYPHLPNRYTTMENISERNHKPMSVYYAWGATLISIALALYIGVRIRLPRSTLILWAIFVGICSVPGLLSFMLLNRWRHEIFGDRLTFWRKKPAPENVPAIV